MDRDEKYLFWILFFGAIMGMTIVGIPLFQGTAPEPVEDSWVSFGGLAIALVLDIVWALALRYSSTQKAPKR